MSWLFFGNGQQIGFSVSTNGVLSAFGNCSHSCRPSTGQMPTDPRMEDVAATWSILTPASEEHEYDGMAFGQGLKNFFAKNGEKTVGRIFFSPPAQAFIHLTVLAPNDFAASAFTLLKAAMGDLSFRFSITADFLGFLPENAPADGIPDHLGWLPKISEFTHPDLLERRAYFSKEISLSVRTFD
jgi:hypothetical protein